MSAKNVLKNDSRIHTFFGKRPPIRACNAVEDAPARLRGHRGDREGVVVEGKPHDAGDGAASVRDPHEALDGLEAALHELPRPVDGIDKDAEVAGC